MTKLSTVLHLLVFASLFTIASCGKDKIAEPAVSTPQKGTNALAGECSCDSTFFPVCSDTVVRYDNACIAKCNGVTTYVNGSCIPDYGLSICVKDQYTGVVTLTDEGSYLGTYGASGRKNIVKYATKCN